MSVVQYVICFVTKNARSLACITSLLLEQQLWKWLEVAMRSSSSRQGVPIEIQTSRGQKMMVLESDATSPQYGDDASSWLFVGGKVPLLRIWWEYLMDVIETRYVQLAVLLVYGTMCFNFQIPLPRF